MAGLPAALFAAVEPLQREVTLPDGTVAPLHFWQLPAAQFRKYFAAIASDDEDAQAAAISRLIAASLCEPDGSPAITVEQAALLTPAAEGAIFRAIRSVNGLDEGKAEPPPAANHGSGTS